MYLGEIDDMVQMSFRVGEGGGERDFQQGVLGWRG